MKRIKVVSDPQSSGCGFEGGCGECRVSCQSAVKTSGASSNQSCENGERIALNEEN